MINELIKTNSTIVENELKKYISKSDNYGLSEVMSYSLLSGGKRIRPFIAIEAYKLFSGGKEDIERVLPFACALEMIHTYSLIHDDMPCMDNDDYRRGKLTNHKVYGEAKALLAGDSLLTYAFEVASENKYVNEKSIVLAINSLAKCAGYQGMAGGQMIDLDSGNNIKSFEELKHMHALKTGELIKCALLLGYYAYYDKINPLAEKDIEKIAYNIGIAFQIRDDILDRISDIETLGKEIGSDERNGKITSLTYFSVQEAQEKVNFLTKEAIEILKKYSDGKENTLSIFAKYLVERKK